MNQSPFCRVQRGLCNIFKKNWPSKQWNPTTVGSRGHPKMSITKIMWTACVRAPKSDWVARRSLAKQSIAASWVCSYALSPPIILTGASVKMIPLHQLRPCGWYITMLTEEEFSLNCQTVTTTVCIAPGNDGSICQNGSKCPICGLNLLHTPELISH